MKKIKTIVSIILVCTTLFPGTYFVAKADNEPVTINLDVEGPDNTIFDSQVSVGPCTTPNNATSTVNGYCAFAAANLPVDAAWSSSGALINSINGVSGDSNNYWLWFINGQPSQVGIDNYMLHDNDTVLWALGREPLQVTLSTTTPVVNATTTVTVLGFNSTAYDFEPVNGATIVGTGVMTDSNGVANIVATSTNPLTISVAADGYIPSQQFTITPLPQQISLTIQDGNTTAYSGNVLLPDSSAPDLQITPTSGTSTVAVSPRGVLGVLENLQASTSTFAITNLSYSSTYNSFLINCIAVPASNSNADCYNWTDAVNGAYPQVGVDHQLLNNGDAVYLYFGSPHRTVLSDAAVAAGQPFTATAQQFNLSTAKYVPLPGVTLGVGTEQPDFSFAELATATADSLGQATFTINATGTFAVGIKEDFYYPTASIVITDASSTPTPTPVPPSGGGGNGLAHQTFNIPNAINFITAQQNSDGSFSSPITTDWTAVAFGGVDAGSAKTKLHNYLQNESPSLSSVTDYERHAMALMALGINPYSGTSINYIQAITNAFDGTQIGTSADNDDIFGLLVLEHAGYTSSDSIIQKDAQYVLSSQQPDGSWDETPDMTAAAITALGSLFDLPNVNGSLGKAAGYLAQTERPDGSWGNVDSTSWVQTAINGIIQANTPGFETEAAWTSTSGYYPTDALANSQQADGGVQSANRLWSTSYALAAASGQSWVTLLQSFPKPTSSSGSVGGGNGNASILSTSTTGSVLGESTSTVSSLQTATSTPAITPTPTPRTTTPTLTSPTPTPIPSIAIKPRLPHKKTTPTKLPIKTVMVPKPTIVAIKPEFTATPTPSAPSTLHTNSGFFSQVWQSVNSFFKWIF